MNWLRPHWLFFLKHYQNIYLHYLLCISFFVLDRYTTSGWSNEALLCVYKCSLCSSMDWHLKFKNKTHSEVNILCRRRMTFLDTYPNNLSFILCSIPHLIMYKCLELYKNLILLKYKKYQCNFDIVFSD